MKRFIIFLVVVGLIYGGYRLLLDKNSFSFRFLSPPGTSNSANIKNSSGINNPPVDPSIIQRGVGMVKGASVVISDAAQQSIDEVKNIAENSAKSWLANQIHSAANVTAQFLGVGGNLVNPSANNSGASYDTVVAMAIKVNQDAPFIINIDYLYQKLGNGSIHAEVDWGDGDSDPKDVTSASQNRLSHKYVKIGTFTAKFVFSGNGKSIQDSIFLSVSD